VHLVQEKLNPELKLLGILPTKFYARSKSNREVLKYLQKEVAEVFPVFKSVIPRDVKAEEAPCHAKPLILYSPSSRASKAYFELSKEVLHSA